MNKKYRASIEQIAIDNEKNSNKAMLPIYKQQKDELDKLNSLLGKLFIDNGVTGTLNMSTSQKANIGVKTLLTNMGKRLGDAEIKKVTSIISDVYKDNYYKNAYEMENNFKVDLKFNMLKKEYVNAAVNQKYKGAMFSDRIWSNKASLIDKLQSGLVNTMNGNGTLQQVAKNIRETFNATASESQRLINTENARVQSQAIDDIGTSSGVEEQLYSATLENHTCAECGSLDGTTYAIDDDSKPEIPEHPNCRCCYINVPYEGWQATQRKDGNTGELIDNTTYAEWSANKGI